MVSVRKIAACMLVGTLTFAGQTGVAKASETPVAGVDLLLSDYYIGSTNYSLAMSALMSAKSEEQVTKLAFADVNNYVNIRSEANEESKILGKLYKDSAATILGEEDGWYQVKSGSVSGYIKGDYLITGKKAEEYSEKVGETIATVTATTLRVREKANTNSTTLTLVPVGEEYKVTKEKKEWVKVKVDASTAGYVSKDYVELSKVYDEAISIEEEQAELAKQQTYSLQTTNSQDSSGSSERSGSSSKTASSNSSEQTSSGNGSDSNSGSNSGSTSSIRQQIVNYALKFEGNPYVWGGTSLTRGADCSGFTQSVLEDFGIYIPRTSREQAASGRRVDLDDIRPGDLIFYRRNGSINHVALYIGNGRVIGAKSSGEGIRITSYNYRTPYKAVSYIN
jgi:cell wall-associated NlpC family hydrolase